MLPNPRHPIRSFLTGCLVLSLAVTLALMAWTLRKDATGTHCAADGAEFFGACQPNLAFLGVGLLWFVLIFGALAFPIVSILVIRRFRPPPGD